MPNVTPSGLVLGKNSYFNPRDVSMRNPMPPSTSLVTQTGIQHTCDTRCKATGSMGNLESEVSQVRMSCPPHLVIFLIATRSYSIQCFLAQQTPGRSTPKQLDPCWGVGVKATNTSCRKALPDTKTQNASHLVLPSALDFITVLVGGHWIKGH